MERIKSVAEILKPLAVIALLSVIQPYRYKREHRKALTQEMNGVPKHYKLVCKSTEHLGVNIPQTQNLSEQTPPFFPFEKVERQHHKYTCVVVIHHCEQS